MFGCPIRGYRSVIIKTRQSLLAFLDQQGFSEPRAKIFIRCARVYCVAPGQGRVPLTEKDLYRPLYVGDTICLPFVISEACQRKIDMAAGTQVLIGGANILEEMERALRSAQKFIYFSAYILDAQTPMPLSGLTFGELIRNILRDKRDLKLHILWNRRTAGGKLSVEDLHKHVVDLIGSEETLQVQVVGGLREEFQWEFDQGSLYEQWGRGLILEILEWIICGAHHSKTLVVDGCVAFCGSADVTSRIAGGRMHEVSAKVTGPAVEGIENDFVLRWNRERRAHAVYPSIKLFGTSRYSVVDELSISKPTQGIGRDSNPISVLRTDPEGSEGKGHDEIQGAYHDLIVNAKRQIYIENQYFRDQNIALLLRKWVLANEDRKLTLLLPNAAEEIVKIDNGRRRTIDELTWSDLGWSDITLKLMIYSDIMAIRHLFSQDPDGNFVPIQNVRILSLSLDADPKLYIHSKLMITDPESDDARMILGSANLNPRGLNARTDYELDVLIKNPGVVVTAYGELMQLFFKGKSAFEDPPETLIPNRYVHHLRLFRQAKAQIIKGESFLDTQYEKFGFLF